MAVVDRPDPADPGPGEVIVHPEASRHLRLGLPLLRRRALRRGRRFAVPARPGSRVRAARSPRSGPDCRPGARAPASVSRSIRCTRAATATRAASGGANTCDNFQLIGIHLDGGLQERLATGQDQVFPIDVRRRRGRRDGRAGVDRRARRRAARGSSAASTSWCSAPARSASASACSRASAVPRCSWSTCRRAGSR